MATKTIDTRPNLGLKNEEAEGVIQILSKLLCDEFLLYTKTRHYHWNVVGPNFGSLHQLFEEQYEQLDEILDATAEYTRTYGGKALGTMQEFIQNARIKEQPGQYPNWEDMVANLVNDHEAIIRSLRTDVQTCEEKFHAIGASNFLTDRMEEHQKMAWMLRAHLEGRTQNR